jgi:hypothetical protein
MHWSDIFVPGVDMGVIMWDLAERFGHSAGRHHHLRQRAWERNNRSESVRHDAQCRAAIGAMDELKLQYMQTVNLRLN